MNAREIVRKAAAAESSASEWLRIAHGRRVYFAEVARFALVDWNDETRGRLAQLSVVDGVYMASTRADYEVLRPHARLQ